MMKNLFKKKKKDKKSKLETDAVAQSPRSDQDVNAQNGVLAIPNNMEVVPAVGTQNVAVNNNTLNQTQNTMNFVINNGTNIHIGNTIYHKPSSKISARSQPQEDENKGATNKTVVEFTSTIKKLCNSKDKITPKFLDLVAWSLGLSWERLVKDVLKLDQPDIEFIVLDFQDRGFKEIAYKNLEKFFQENQDEEKNTIGWLISTMWKNDFKIQVRHIKDKYKTIDWSIPEVPEEVITETIKVLMESQVELDDCVLDLIAQSLGKKYELLGDLLNIEKPQLEYLEKDYVQSGHKEVNFPFKLNR